MKLNGIGFSHRDDTGRDIPVFDLVTGTGRDSKIVSNRNIQCRVQRALLH